MDWKVFWSFKISYERAKNNCLIKAAENGFLIILERIWNAVSWLVPWQLATFSYKMFCLLILFIISWTIQDKRDSLVHDQRTVTGAKNGRCRRHCLSQLFQIYAVNCSHNKQGAILERGRCASIKSFIQQTAAGDAHSLTLLRSQINQANKLEPVTTKLRFNFIFQFLTRLQR